MESGISEECPESSENQTPTGTEEMEPPKVIDPISEMLSSNVSKLGRCGIGLNLVYNQLCLAGQDLCDTSYLKNYVYLQKLEVPHTKIKDLSFVSCMPNLIILDASHNEISDFFNFDPPKNLQEVNLSHNCMSRMKDLSAFGSLVKLCLDYNNFTEVFGLEKCWRLMHLSIAHNKVSRVGEMNDLPLKYLCLKDNQLERIETLDNLKRLQILDLSQNRITTLCGLQSLLLLNSLNLADNQISEIEECRYINDLLLLSDLNLLRNPMQAQPDYREAVIFLLQHLTNLDEENVTSEEKVKAVNKFDPPLELLSARNHMANVVYQLIQPQVLYESTCPSADFPYPILVITGPLGSGKREMVQRLCEEVPDFFGRGICHTTREPDVGEENNLNYHFVNDEVFQNMMRKGKFNQTSRFGGHQYGLSIDTVEAVAHQGQICCLEMELESVYGFKKSYFKPKLILLFPSEMDLFINSLARSGLYTSEQIEIAMKQAEHFSTIVVQQPGFFNEVIPCDDWDEAWYLLLQIVKEDLSIEEVEKKENDEPQQPSATVLGQSTTKPPEPESQVPTTSDTETTQEPSVFLSKYRRTKIKLTESLPKTAAELASIQRRETPVREAILGKNPWVYSKQSKSTSEEPSLINFEITTFPQEHVGKADESQAAAGQPGASYIFSSLQESTEDGSEDDSMGDDSSYQASADSSGRSSDKFSDQLSDQTSERVLDPSSGLASGFVSELSIAPTTELLDNNRASGYLSGLQSSELALGRESELIMGREPSSNTLRRDSNFTLRQDSEVAIGRGAGRASELVSALALDLMSNSSVHIATKPSFSPTRPSTFPANKMPGHLSNRASGQTAVGRTMSSCELRPGSNLRPVLPPISSRRLSTGAQNSKFSPKQNRVTSLKEED